MARQRLSKAQLSALRYWSLPAAERNRPKLPPEVSPGLPPTWDALKRLGLIEHTSDPDNPITPTPDGWRELLRHASG